MALAVAPACVQDQAGYAGQLDFGAISALASSANNHALGLEQHADDLAATAEADSSWLSIAGEARASARTLRALADNARAVVRVHQQGVEEPGGMLSDGLSLVRPGEALLRQTDDLDSDIHQLLASANADHSRMAPLQALAGDVEVVRQDARVAIQQGNLLVERARQIARSLGTDIE